MRNELLRQQSSRDEMCVDQKQAAQKKEAKAADGSEYKFSRHDELKSNNF